MAQKRKRRTTFQTTGLAPGETLKRSKLTGRDYPTWDWVSDISDASEISHDHLLRTCGFSPNCPRIFCPNKYANPLERSSDLALPGQKVSDQELDDDCVVITEDELSSCDKKFCQSNPYCLNYLGQKGWEDYENAKSAYLKLANLGQNPIFQVREPGHPVGLKNLGATCYANALLQVWFQDLPFRSGVYRCQPTQDAEHKFEESPVFQLQVTFAALQDSTQNVFNPVKLVESLKLRTTEQQDAQEFSKLFMSHLDSEFQKQHNPDLKSLVASQFQGKQVYGTVCEKCKCRSERDSDFLEIEVSIDKNGAKLDDRVAASLKPETLTGDNKYFCSRCDNLQDATRYTAYTGFPPVLHFSLLRFVYDLSSMERKKSKHVISFPTHLDMNQFLRPEERSSNMLIYDLRGVLLHKGVSAYHGHYEAQVFDIPTSSWYQYNDEIVTKVESLGAKLPDCDVVDVDDEDQQEKQPKPLLQVRQRKKRRIDSDEEAEPAERCKKSSEYFSSKDAYMLVYVRRKKEDESVLFLDGTSLSNNRRHPVPPARALRVVQSLNQEHDKRCDEYQKNEKETMQHFDRLRRQVMEIYQTWTASSTGKSIVVSRKTLETFLQRNRSRMPTLTKSESSSTRTQNPLASASSSDSALEKEPDLLIHVRKGNESSPSESTEASFMTDIICEHGGLDPLKASNMKCIDSAVLEKISTYCDGISPTLTTDDVCLVCVTKIYEEKAYQFEHPRLVSAFEEACNADQEVPGFWISKHWLKDWKSVKPKMHMQGQEDPPPDSPDFAGHVHCEHGNLCPNTTHRRRITQEATQILQVMFPTWNPLSTEGKGCLTCEALLHVSKEGKREVRKQAEDEKARLKHMYENGLSRNTTFLENIPCCIIPTKFIRDWKQWLLKPTEVSRPIIVDLAKLNCEHGLIAVDPNAPSDMDSSITLITRSDWDILQNLYVTGPVISVERRTAGDGHSFFHHDRDVCQECRRRRKVDFDSTELTIRIMRPNDPIPTESSMNGKHLSDDDNVTDVPLKYGSSNGGVRHSKRLRQGKGRRQKRKIVVWKRTTIGDIKLQLQEELGIPTISQTLFYCGIELDDKCQSMEDIGLTVNDVIDLKQEAEDLDILDEDADVPQKRPRQDRGVEGFGGTLLGGFSTDSSADDRDFDINDLPPESSSPPAVSVKSCPACTFENSFDDAQCEICAYKFGTE